MHGLGGEHSTVGLFDGSRLGWLLGLLESISLGLLDGTLLLDGSWLGSSLGVLEGVSLGILEGVSLGLIDGERLGA